MALSGQLIWGPISNGAYFSFEWTATQDPSSRTSTVSWKMYGRGRSSSPTYIASNYYLSVDGNNISELTGSWDGSSKFSFNNAKKDSGSFTVYHSSDGSGSFYAEIYAYISSSSYNWDTVGKTFDLDNIGSSNYSWKKLGSGTASSVSYNLSSKEVGYYLYTPSSAGTLTIYTSSSGDTYGGIGVNGSVSLTSDSSAYGSNIVSGYIARDDDSGTNNNFQVSGVSLSANTTYRIYVHQYSGDQASGTLYMSFTAKTTYTVTFNANGGSGAPSAINCSIGGSITIPTTKPIRSGKIFLGWSTSSTAIWSTSTTIIGATYTPSNDVTLYAVWGYTLTINPNGGNMISRSYYDSDNKDSYATSTSSYTVGFTKTSYYGRDLANFQAGYWYRTINSIKYYNIPFRVGYTFNGWTVTSGNGQVVYEAPNTGTTHKQVFYNDDKYCYIRSTGDDYGLYYYINNETTPSNSTIAAQWIANSYTVTFDPNGGDTPSQTTKTVTYDQLYGTLPTVSRLGYTFDGWYTEASGGYQIASNNIVTIAGNHTLYAHWTLSTATLTLTKGTGINGVTIDGAAVTSKTITIGNSVTINATLNPGYHWKNWTSGTSTTQVSASQSYTFNMPSSAITYKANGVANTYTVVYNANGGTGTTTNSSHTYETSKALTTNSFSKFGYNFRGWATTLERAQAGTVDYADGASVKNLTTTHQGIVNLYAVWEIRTQVYIYTNKKDGTSKWVPVQKFVYTSS